MSEYLKRAEELRNDDKVHCNCAQAVFIPFAEKAGMSTETAYAITAHFGSGMRMGSVCGAVTGGLMALGLCGKAESGAANEFLRKVRGEHEECLNCRDLLRMNAERGGDKKVHCDGMVYECVRDVEEML